MGYTSLSAQQMDCLALLAVSQNLDQIALALGVSKRQVEQQLDAARVRLGVRTQRQAAVIAAELGLIPTPSGWLPKDVT